ncbi:hypothetical protein XCR_0424 [Xanthomonas campestris pv. raphani 756C]|nr:hypothetical protein XCR_0424 [Xanthomonas campestris pv. raphani 756C]
MWAGERALHAKRIAGNHAGALRCVGRTNAAFAGVLKPCRCMAVAAPAFVHERDY